MKAVIETNVAISANGKDTHASLLCQLECINFIERVVSSKSKDLIYLDSAGYIFKEYSKHLNYNGQPGVGDMYFKYMHDHMYMNDKVKIVQVTPISNEERGFEELPENSVDKSDRIFLATALVSRATIFNALDSDWHEQAEFLKSLRVHVKQLCPEHGCR